MRASSGLAALYLTRTDPPTLKSAGLDEIFEVTVYFFPPGTVKEKTGA
jgi:tripartite-type tricarboxylate transporter receptor subunit TctC